jgi:inorganic pyrophosphatase
LPSEFNTVIETFGSSVKYELGKASDLISSTAVTRRYYPANYGFIPRALAEVTTARCAVLCQETVVPLTHPHARAIGLMTMITRAERCKIIAWRRKIPGPTATTAEQMPPHHLIMLRRFAGTNS